MQLLNVLSIALVAASTAFATPISLSESTGVVVRDEVSAQSED
jgi:hypothetical protein